MTARANRSKPRRVRVRETSPRPAFAPALPKLAFDVVGKSINRVDANEKVTAETQYVDDLRCEGSLLFGCVLRTSFPHARIKRIDISRARALPGVHAVLTHQDVPGRNAFGMHKKDQPLLAAERVRYWGDAVAMVAAASEALAQRAIELIDVDYDPLPVIEDPQAALTANAPAIHAEGNLGFQMKVRKGNVETGFPHAAVVVEQTYQTPFIDHAPIEPIGALAVPRGDGGLTIYCPTQLPHTAYHEVAAVLGLNPTLLNLEFTMMGGGFGGKEDVGIDISCRAALLALKTGQPVKVVYSREEQMRVAPKRHPMLLQYRTGTAQDGRLVAAEVNIYNELGAYESASVGVSLKACTHAVGPYVIPNVKVDLYGVYTNNPPTGAMRAFGAPQVTFAFEQQMDELAERLEMSPVDFRLLNGLRAGDATATKQVLDASVGLIETIEKASARSEFDRKWRGWQPDPDSGRLARGIGIAASYFGLSIRYGREAGTAVVRARADGRIEFDTGVGELGQGSYTVLAQIAAEALAVPIEQVAIAGPDTARSPEYGTTAASLATTIGGNGVLLAGQEARRMLEEHAAQLLDVPPNELRWQQGIISGRGKTIAVSELVKALWHQGEHVIARARWVPPEHWYDHEKGEGNPFFVYSFATAVAEVTVDREIGTVTVETITIAEDVGRAINPTTLSGQIEGGVHMGVGYALMEEQPWRDGRSAAINLHNYTIPTTMDMPAVNVVIVEDPSPFGPFGAKGAGEPPVNPIAPAIANAIYNAVGVRVRELPITAEKVLRGLRQEHRRESAGL